MNQELEFTKMSGTGNDFIVFDNRDNILPQDKSALAKKICERKRSIGADGILIIEESQDADFTMRIINQDGSEAEMCGNGARCIAYYAFVNKIADRNMTFDTQAGLIKADIFDNNIKLQLSDPYGFKESIKLDDLENISFINTGVPHTVLFSDNIDEAKVNSIGSKVRYHQYFKPDGTNVNFVEVVDEKTIKTRTYERGVEHETFACGSGSTACALIAGFKEKVKSPVNVITRGGDLLKVYFNINKENKTFKNIYLKGTAEITYKGKVRIR